MSILLGETISLTLFGESHGKGVGAVVTGLPAGEKIDEDAIRTDMERRRPGGNFTTARREQDEVDILSGTYRGYTTGAPLAVWIQNNDAKSKDYESIPFRPGHADYPAHIKYAGYEDPRGGGHFSGRLTAPLVAVGSVAKTVLNRRGVVVESEIEDVGGYEDKREIARALADAKRDGDSLGGTVRVVVKGVPAGVGGPRFSSLQSKLAAALYGVGAVKSVSFGAGERVSEMRGSENNDSYRVQGDNVRTKKNDAGGILGGIANGEDIVVRVAVKPTPSIGQKQHTVDRDGREIDYAVKGRHDTALVLRIPVVLESAVALVVLDALRSRIGEEEFRTMRVEREDEEKERNHS